jgi:uncharacterized protein YndB with AHSA1/START domain
MNITTSTWSTFTLQIPIKADVQSLYKAWATQEGIERWFLRSAKYTDGNGVARRSNELIQKDDRYHWLWHGYSDDATEKRVITDANGRDRFQFEFSGDCLVTVTLHSNGGMTMVKLVQDRIPEDNNPSTNLFVGCQLGWTFYLTNLKSIFEGGIDLRNRDVSLRQVINA